MNKTSNRATTQRPQGDRVIDANLVTIDLPSRLQELREETAWNVDDRNAITVFSTNGMRIVLVALHKGAEMIKHVAEGLLSVHVLEGTLQFDADERSVELSAGHVLALHEGIPHSIRATDETVFLLTLTTTMARK